MIEWRNGYFYMMMNENNNVIYAGVTSDLKKRVYEHKQDLVKGFTQKYKVHRLVYYEVFNAIQDAIAREKQIKAGSRKKKLDLVKAFNPEFEDLYDKI